eukprot:COSAG04_NODE_2547_length_3951_cov_4.320353_4_plen_246_part_00
MAVCEYAVESLDRTVRDRILNKPQLTEVGFRLKDDGTREVTRMPWVQTELGFAELFDGESGLLCERGLLANFSIAEGGGPTPARYLVSPSWQHKAGIEEYKKRYRSAVRPLTERELDASHKACLALIEDREDELGLAVRDAERMRVYVQGRPLQSPAPKKAKKKKQKEQTGLIEDYITEEGVGELKRRFCGGDAAGAALCPRAREWREALAPKYVAQGDFVPADAADEMARKQGMEVPRMRKQDL